MRELKFIHFLEVAKDGNKYIDGWVNKQKMWAEKQINLSRSTMRNLAISLVINLKYQETIT